MPKSKHRRKGVARVRPAGVIAAGGHNGQHMTGCLDCMLIRMQRNPENFRSLEMGCHCGAVWEAGDMNSPWVRTEGPGCPDCIGS